MWQPIGNRGYAALRRTIMAGRSLDNELTWGGAASYGAGTF